MRLKPSPFSLTAGSRRNNASAGQSLVELIVAVSLGAIFVLGVVTAISVTLRLSAQNKHFQTTAFLAQELLDNTTVVAEYDWRRIADLAPPAVTYYLDTGVTPFAVVSNPPEETIVINDTPYARRFMVEPVSRDSGGNIESVYNSANDDPSSKKVTVTVSWTGTQNVTMTKFITRSRNQVALQSDWSGGGGQPGALLDPGKFDTQSGVDFSGVSGAVKLQGF